MEYCCCAPSPIWCERLFTRYKLHIALMANAHILYSRLWRCAQTKPFSRSSIRYIEPDILMRRHEKCVSQFNTSIESHQTIELQFEWIEQKTTKCVLFSTFYRLFTQIVALRCCVCIVDFVVAVALAIGKNTNKIKLKRKTHAKQSLHYSF